jgi:hypothetical protein
MGGAFSLSPVSVMAALWDVRINDVSKYRWESINLEHNTAQTLWSRIPDGAALIDVESGKFLGASHPLYDQKKYLILTKHTWSIWETHSQKKQD